MSDDQKQPRVIRLDQLASTKNNRGIVPVSPSTIWRWIAQGNFPRGRKLGPKVTVWDEADIYRWIKEQSKEAEHGN
jgi:prophage regulatory protein